MEDLSLAIKFLDDHNITYVIGKELAGGVFEGLYCGFIGHYSLIELKELLDVCSKAQQEYGEKFPIYTFDSFLSWDFSGRPVELVYGNPSDFNKFPATVEAQKENDKKIEMERVASLFGNKYKQYYGGFLLSFPFLLTVLGLQLSACYILTLKLGYSPKSFIELLWQHDW